MPSIFLKPLITLAQATQPAGNEPWWAQLFKSPLPLVMAAVVIMLLLSSRSKKNQDKQRQDMLAQLKRGDEVETIGGIVGKVYEVRDDRVQVKVDETSNTKVWFRRSAIHKVIVEEKAAS